MNAVQRVAKNTGMLLVAHIVSYALSFFYIMYAARYLGADGFGILSFALAFAGIFGAFGDLGLSTLTVREVARERSRTHKYVENIIAIKIFLSIATFGLISFTLNILDYSDNVIKSVYIVALSVILTSFTNIFNSIFQAHEDMQYISIERILNSMAMFFGILIAININFSVVEFALIYFVASVIDLSYSFIIFALKFKLPGIEVDWDFWKLTIMEALPFGISIIFVMVFYWSDSVMLSIMKGDEVVGWYNAAYRVILALLFIPNMFITSIFPIMSKYNKTNQDSLKFSFERSFKYLTIIGIPIGVGTTILAKRIILLIFGVEYVNSIVALQILVWSSVFIFMSITFANLFNSMNKQIIITKITGVCLLINVVLNLIVIPKYSLIGASTSTVLTEFFSLAFCFICFQGINDEYKILSKELAINVIKVFISSALMGIAIIYFSDLNLMLLIAFSILVYIVMLYMAQAIDNEDLSLLRRLLQSKHIFKEMEVKND